jgi:hypothetical protein
VARPGGSRPTTSSAVRRLVADGAAPGVVATRFGLSESTVRAVVLRRSYASLAEEPGVDRAAAVVAYRGAAARRKASARAPYGEAPPAAVPGDPAPPRAGSPGDGRRAALRRLEGDRLEDSDRPDVGGRRLALALA